MKYLVFEILCDNYHKNVTPNNAPVTLEEAEMLVSINKRSTNHPLVVYQLFPPVDD